MPSQIEELRSWRQQSYDKHLYATAEMIADQIYTLTADVDDAYWLAEIYYASGSYLRAARLLRSGENFLAVPKCRYIAARCLVAAQELDEAVEVIQSGGSDEVLTDEFSHSSSMRDDDTENSEISISALLKYLLGQVYVFKSDYTEARDAYIEALRLDPRCFEALDQLRSHQMLTAKEEWELVKSLDFTSRLGANADLVRAMYGLRLSKLTEMSSLRDTVDVLASNYGIVAARSAPMILAEAETLYARSQFSACRELCERALADDKNGDPYAVKLYIPYVAALFDLGDAPMLYKVAFGLVSWAAENPIAWYAIGVYYLAADKPSEARRYFSKASIMDPCSMPAWMGFAHTFALEGEHEQAIAAYTSAVKLFPGSHLPFMCLGMQHVQLNNFALAEHYLSCASNYFDEDPLLLNERAVVSYHQGYLGAALQYLEQAETIVNRLGCNSKKFVCIQSNLGFVHRKRGNIKTAIHYFEKVLLLAPLDANILSALALCHMQLWDPMKAITRLDQALGVSPQNPVARDLLHRAIEEATDKSLPSAHLNTAVPNAESPGIEIDVDLV